MTATTHATSADSIKCRHSGDLLGESRKNIAAPSFLKWDVEDGAGGTRLADYLATRLLMTLEDVRGLIEFGSVQAAGRPARDPARLLRAGEEIRVYQPWSGVRRFYEIDPARILFRDAYVLAYDKEAGAPSQQTPSDAYNNTFAALQRHLKKERGADSYAALHHRLDRDTSGVILFAIHRRANRELGEAFKGHSVVKDYLTWAGGSPARDEWISDEDICRGAGRYAVCPKGKGKGAETRFEVLRRETNATLLLARPLTGRTHQIRLHLAACGHPVLGDRIYGGAPANRLHLHAHRIRLAHPVTGRELRIAAPPPSDWLPPFDVREAVRELD
ncbi:MAG: RluA family pseudouridine synthase [Syntrophobacteraceae bacterium]|jgi:23S rRNA pseudouridine1911/1915/1917 synthase